MLILALLMALLVTACTPSPASPTVGVSRLGARPDDGKDDTAVVARAIEQAAKTKARRIVFPKGRYDFHAGANPANPGAMMAFSELDGIEIDGRGSEFRFDGLAQGLTFYRCSNVLRNVCRSPGRDEGAYGVRIINCGNVRLRDNHLPKEGQGVGFRGDVKVTP